MRGVRQNCVLSPMILDIYLELIFRETLDGLNEKILTNGEIINIIRCNDNTVIFADCIEGLKHIISIM